MSRESERLFDTLGEIGEEMLAPVLEQRQTSQPLKWKRWAALAAVLVLGVGLWRFLPRMGGSSSGGSGSSGSSVFMSYAGPVFPLAAVEETKQVTARREITLDFSPWEPVWISNEQQVEAYTERGASAEEAEDYRKQLEEWFPDGGYESTSTDILVRDDYLLTNTGSADQTLTLLYPFASNLEGLEQLRPQLTVEGEEGETALRWGGYSGGFQGPLGGDLTTETEKGSVNLRQLDSWSQYQALLTDGSYLSQALGERENLEGIPVTVYRFTDPWGPEEETEEIPNPTIRVTYRQPEKTVVLSYGFHGMSRNEETGEMGQSFSIPQPQEPRYGKDFYFIVIGEDLEEMEITGYNTGGWDTTQQVEAGVTVERYQGDLDDSLRQIFQEYLEEYALPSAAEEMWYQQFVELLLSSGPLSGQSAERYASGWLEDLMSEAKAVSRVFYLEAQVTIPAGETLRVTAEMTKNASYDYACAKTENRGIYGYDLVTTLGSPLAWESQRAVLEDRGQIEIVRQNFGFDPEQGLRTVELDPEEGHYYLEARRKEK